MRVTNANMANSYMYNIQSTTQKIDKLNKELTGQNVINKVSDDPFKAIKVMNLKNEITSVENLNSNADELLGWAEQTDGVLDSIGNLTNEIKNLVTSISSIHSESDISSITKEVTEKVKQIAELFNSTYAGQNIFSGTATDEKTVNIVTNPNGSIRIEKSNNINNGTLKGEVSPGITISYNATVDEVTNNGELFDTLNDVLATLNTMPIDFNKINDLKEGLDKGLSSVLDARSSIGAKINSIENMKENNISNIEKMSETLSMLNDIDIAQKAVELKSAELVYAASLQVGAKLMQNTILDYIR